MIELIISVIVILAIASLLLWAVGQFAPAELQRPLRIIVIAVCVIVLLRRLWPLLGGV